MDTDSSADLMLKSWERLRDRFDELSRSMPDFDLEVMTTNSQSRLCNEDVLRLVDIQSAIWKERSDSLMKRNGWTACFNRSVGNAADCFRARSRPQHERPPRRDCRWGCAVDPSDFQRLADDAGRLLFQIPETVAAELWSRKFIPTQSPESPLVYWVEAILQLSLRSVPGSPLSRSAKCWAWNHDWRNQPKVRCTVALPLEFVTGEMPVKAVGLIRYSVTKDQAVDPSFWFAELSGFLAKSCYAVDCIVGELRKSPSVDFLADLKTKAIQIAQSQPEVARREKKKTVGDRMAEIYTNDRSSGGWSSEAWAELLGCDPSTVRKTKTWEAIELEREAAKRSKKGKRNTVK